MLCDISQFVHRLYTRTGVYNGSENLRALYATGLHDNPSYIITSITILHTLIIYYILSWIIISMTVVNG